MEFFPPSWTGVDVFRANGVRVRVEAMVDASVPMQEQQKFSRQIELYDEQEQVLAASGDGRRCLKVVLTDEQVREAIGFEFVSIPWLGTSPNLLLDGDIMVMNGLLFLTPTNCREMARTGPAKKTDDDIEITDDFLDY